ncbi:MAG: hypothetical protein M0R47_21145 [Methylobacter sp.]|uniref:hypothetical protein n=1 Tax=Methylobacter sp. TaxID=2051955 RepID=UPI0025D2F29F|nr:hypothetical protein [Methylobacter sp.]MCK9623030.1 hypothetical protein [Methylobacter sp.]
MSNSVNEGGQDLFKAATAISTASIGANVDALVTANAGLRLVGYSAKESAATPALSTLRIINGATGATNSPVVNIDLALSTSETVWFGDGGVACPAGLSIDWLTGQADVVLFYKVV